MATSDVLIVGGGAVGVSVAYYVSQQGARVTLVERGEIGRGCSYGNAGLIVPSHCMPEASPQALAQGLKWLLDPRSPITIKPRADAALLLWLLRFGAACRWRTATETMGVLRRLGVESLKLYTELAQVGGGFWMRRAGWLHVYRTVPALEHGLRHAGFVRGAGTQVEQLDAPALQGLEPALQGEWAGGIYYPEDAHLQPYQFVSFLAQQARNQGVSLLTGIRVKRLKTAGGQVQALITDAGEFSAKYYVLAAGAWSAPLLRPYLGQIPLQPAKGHSLTVGAAGAGLSRPLKFGEANVVVTPMGPQVRLTTGFDLVGFEPAPAAARVETLRQLALRLLPHAADVRSAEAWIGYRPATPDSLPMIGPTARWPNLLLATGHGTLGMSLAPITGKLVAEFLSGARPSIDLQPLLPRRFGL